MGYTDFCRFLDVSSAGRLQLYIPKVDKKVIEGSRAAPRRQWEVSVNCLHKSLTLVLFSFFFFGRSLLK